MNKNAIQINSISKKYKDFYAVNKATLSIKQGEIYGLVGKNGAGKTTLFKLILGLSEPTEGTMSISGSNNIHELRQERSHIGFYINPNFYDYLSASQNLEYYRRLKGISDKGEVDRVLKIVGLYGIKKPFKAFSMGMKQRLGIANALLGDPDIIILDEPINGLDPQGIVEIRNLLKDLNRNQHKTLIVSSHILSELDLIADTFGIIDHGIILDELKKENFKDKNNVHLLMNTSNNSLALEVLKNEYEIDASINDKDYLELELDTISNKALLSLIDKNIQIIEIIKNKITLEDYYFELTERGA